MSVEGTGTRRQGTGKRLLILLLMLAVALGICVFAVACGGEKATTTTAGEPIKVGFDEGFTSFMAYDYELAEKGVKTALAMLDNQFQGRPIEYFPVDNGSDPVVAVDKARQLVESDPECSLMGQPSDNLTTANKLAFIPAGLYGSWGYYFGKYVSEELGYKTANCINYEDTAVHNLQSGFEKGFAEGGGKVVSVNYVSMDTVDFSAYLSALKPADCTYFWIIGNGSAPFVKQCHDYGLTAPLVVPMANNFVEEQLGPRRSRSWGSPLRTRDRDGSWETGAIVNVSAQRRVDRR
jgi:ABC-type branched-subunit amino acid transport system substrate-binding protein